MSDNEPKKTKSAPAKGNADRAANPSAGDYSVGYGRPPVASKFKKGRSGNPSGRPRGSRSFATMVGKLLSDKHPVVMGGKVCELVGMEVLARGLFKKGSKGDLQAIREMVESQANAEKAKRVAIKITSDMSAVEAAKAYQRLINGTDID